jgi:hypothetical protein
MPGMNCFFASDGNDVHELTVSRSNQVRVGDQTVVGSSGDK